MRVVPAVDIRGGLCVNLVQGDYAQETVFSEDPVDQAIQWRDDGAGLVHIVDLDGAKAGRCCIEPQLAALREADVAIEVGGGIRDLATVETLAGLGVERIILGTAAHDDPEFLSSACAAHPGKIVAGIDARAGKVSLHAWESDTATDAVDFARRVEAAGVSRIIYTDILSDGAMKGPNTDATRAVAEAVTIPVTVSGGMSSLDDIRSVSAIESHGVDEVIIGRALYLKVFTLPEALAVAEATAAR